MRVLIVTVLLVAVSAVPTAYRVQVPSEYEFQVEPTIPSPELLAEWMENHGAPALKPEDPIPTIVGKLAIAAKNYATPRVEARKHLIPSEDVTSDPYPYFGFIPTLGAKVLPSGKKYEWKGNCFQSSSATAAFEGKNLHVDFTFASASGLLCTETMLLGTSSQYSIQEVVLHGSKRVTFDFSNSSAADVWDAENNGVRVFLFQQNVAGVMNSIAQTAELFAPVLTRPVYEWEAKKNIDFLEKYRGMTFKKRNVTDVILDESEIHSGDFLGVLRLDGLDPMLAWAMGSTTGHTTVALWGDDGQLYICESTATSSYWDANGIQKTPYREWIKFAKEASYHVVHLPLSPTYRALFNTTAAWEFFNKTEGFDYGYNNMLWGWVDTFQNNYPCVPPNYDRCLNWDIIEVLFPVISRYVPKFRTFWDQAFNFRLGTQNLDFPELLQAAVSKGITPHDIPTIVEQDSFQYQTTRNGAPAVGPSMVCCAFVCHTWKAAGVFSEIDNEINCGEFTNWDDSALAIFDKDYKRPQACVDADPDNIVCQILGEYTLSIAQYNSKPAFAHMAENCPGIAPSYDRPATC